MTQKAPDSVTCLRPGRQASIQDLARMVGVSHVTVSRAFFWFGPCCS